MLGLFLDVQRDRTSNRSDQLCWSFLLVDEIRGRRQSPQTGAQRDTHCVHCGKACEHDLWYRGRHLFGERQATGISFVIVIRESDVQNGEIYLVLSQPLFCLLRAARQELDKQDDIKLLLRDFHAQSEKMAKLQEADKPIEVDDKHKLQELQDKLISQEVFKKFTAAQVEYVDLMRRVNETLRKQLAKTEKDAD